MRIPSSMPGPILPHQGPIDLSILTDEDLEVLKVRQEERLRRPPPAPRRRRKGSGIPTTPLEEGYEFGAWFEGFVERFLCKWAALVGVNCTGRRSSSRFNRSEGLRRRPDSL